MIEHTQDQGLNLSMGGVSDSAPADTAYANYLATKAIKGLLRGEEPPSGIHHLTWGAAADM